MTDFNSITRILIILIFLAIVTWTISYIVIVVVGQNDKEFFFEIFKDVLISSIFYAVPTALFACLSIYHPLNSDEKNCYEITVNEKSFKTSDFKTKSNGSIMFTSDDGTIIRASEYEIRKLN